MVNRPVDAERAQEFARRLLGHMNGAAVAQLVSIGHRSGLFDAMAALGPATSDEIAAVALFRRPDDNRDPAGRAAAGQLRRAAKASKSATTGRGNRAPAPAHEGHPVYPAGTTGDAARTGLNERYVREWLNGLTVARIVEYDSRSLKYHLPPEHAASLTRSAGLKNMATMALLFPMLGSVEPQVLKCFEQGGGVPYSAYEGFTAFMAERSAQRWDALLISKVLPAVPGLVAKLRRGIDVADVGCGSGHAVNLMAQDFPKSRFTGFDFSEAAVKAAREESRRLGLTNTRFEVRDAAEGLGRHPERSEGSGGGVPTNSASTHSRPGSPATPGLTGQAEMNRAAVPAFAGMKDGAAAGFDLITTFDAIHDQAHPRKVLANIFQALRPGGIYLMVEPAGTGRVEQDLDDALAPFKYTVSLMHCMTVSLAYGGEGLGTMWGEQAARTALREAGFSRVTVTRVEGDALNAYYIARRAKANG